MSGLSSELVLYLMNQGVRQADIARDYGVSRQYIYKLAKLGGHVSPITTITENLPWDVDSDLLENHVYHAVRIYGHAQLVGIDNISQSSRDKINALVRKLKGFNLAVDYDPEYPPIPGVINLPGFAFIHRTEEDEDFIFKIRPGVRITPPGGQDLEDVLIIPGSPELPGNQGNSHSGNYPEQYG